MGDIYIETTTYSDQILCLIFEEKYEKMNGIFPSSSHKNKQYPPDLNQTEKFICISGRFRSFRG